MPSLPNDILEQIDGLAEAGDTFAAQGDYDAALDNYWAAWDLLPEPQTESEAATWLLMAIGDTYFLAQDFESGRDNLSTAMHCPDGLGNPFLHLRLGQCFLGLNDRQRAVEELLLAYEGGGAAVFAGEKPKYFKLLKSSRPAPEGGW